MTKTRDALNAIRGQGILSADKSQIMRVQNECDYELVVQMNGKRVGAEYVEILQCV